MDKIKLALCDFFSTLKNYALKKDENSKIKYKNLIVVSVVVLALIIALVFAFIPSNDTSMKLHPNDATSANEEVSFEDNNAIAIDPQSVALDENALTLQSNALQNSQSKTDSSQVSVSAEKTNESHSHVNASESSPFEAPTLFSTNDANASSATPEATQAEENQSNPRVIYTQTITLFCGKYQSTAQANEAKASIAFATGLISKVISKDDTFRLLLGPYTTRDEALSVFNKLDSLKLVDECSLETKN